VEAQDRNGEGEGGGKEVKRGKRKALSPKQDDKNKGKKMNRKEKKVWFDTPVVLHALALECDNV